MTIIFYGPPGVGKGTQAQLACTHLHMAHISTGNTLREEIQRKSDLGREVEQILKTGNLVSDAIVNELVKHKISELFPGVTDFLFDGYPRTLEQAKALDETLSEFGLEIFCVINLVADRDELLRRLTGRRTCRSCGASFHVHFNPSKVEGICDNCSGKLVQRPDDNAQSVIQRLDAFELQTRPLLDYYRRRGVLVDVDAIGQIYDVHKRVRDIVEPMDRRSA